MFRCEVSAEAPSFRTKHEEKLMIVVQPPKHNEIRSLYNVIFVIRNVKKLSYLGFRVLWCEANGSKRDCVARFSVPDYWISNILRI